METKFFNDITLGFEVNNVKDILNASSLGLYLCNANGEYFGNEDVTDEDEDGIEIEREPTEEEIVDRAIEELKCGGTVYASLYVPYTYKMVKDKETCLQSDLYVGQHAFAMVDNKITEVSIIYISLSKGEISKGDMDSALSSVAENLYYTIGFCFKNSLETYVPSDKEKAIKNSVKKYAMSNQVIACYYSKNHNVIYDTFPLEEVFATKEELVKHLMEE